MKEKITCPLYDKDYRHKIKYVHGMNDLPEAAHFAVLNFGSITIPGDERSRTNPGHGYPESTESTIEYIAFTDEETLKRWIQFEEQGEFKRPGSYRVIQVKPLTVTKKVEVAFV